MESEQYKDAMSELSIEKGCEEYRNSVKLTLALINHQLEDALVRNYNNLEELSLKIEARVNFLKDNPSFLSYLVYNRNDIKREPILEFDEIRVALEEYSKRITEKLREAEDYHDKLLELVEMNGRDEKATEGSMKATNATKEQEEEFQDCIEKSAEETAAPKAEIDKDESGSNCLKRTYNRISIRHDSDMSLSSEANDPPNKKFQIFTDISATADIERRRPQEDLHGKLVQLIVATDSLEGFRKLMKRKPSQRGKNKISANLESRYTGSLWFFPSKNARKKNSRTSVSVRRPAKKAPPQCSLSASTSCNLITRSRPVPLGNEERSKRIKQGLTRAKLKYYDLLDDIDQCDIKPIKSEYPRRDNIYQPTKLEEAKSYLHRMMQENDKVWRRLLQPAAPLSKKKKKKPQLQAQKVREVQNLMEYLTAPQQKYLSRIPQSLIVMPVRVTYDNFPTKDNDQSTVLITDLSESRKIEDNSSTNDQAGESKKKPEGVLLSTRTPEGRTNPFQVHRRQEMLNQLKGLKVKNDNIQKNIQKAIDVIETKMIDLLSSQTVNTGSEAFNAMEEQITNVLKLMNDSDQREDHEMKNYVEKDSSPRVRRGMTTIKTPRPERGDLCEIIRSTDANDNSIARDAKETEKKNKKKHNEKSRNEQKKTADIGEGERLLGQVDNVIKKIDSIYTKISDDTKNKNQSKQEKATDFPEEALQTPAETPVLIHYKLDERTPLVHSVVHTFRTAEVFHTSVLQEGMLSSSRENSQTDLEEFGECETEGVFLVETATDSTFMKSTENIDKRHDCVLGAFYTFFFSSIFVALNFDYAA